MFFPHIVSIQFGVLSSFSFDKMKLISLLPLRLFALFVIFVLFGRASGKECTNIPTQLSSHTVRYELLSSENETLKKEMFSYYHLIPSEDSAWSSLLPRKILAEKDEISWAMMYRNVKSQNGFKDSSDFLKEMSLHDVRLDPNGIHGRAQQTNLEYLLMLDEDSLLWSFRKTAGLPTNGTAYGGWEDPTVELRGHFVGHYLSATAQMWASTRNGSLEDKMSKVVSGLSACQEKIGTGYLSAFPSEAFDRFEAIKPVWAPYYTIHKILAGLLDQYTFADNSQALKMVTWMVDYFYNRVQNVIFNYSVERHYLSLNEETGGMNDVLYRLYSITGSTKHLVLAHLFDKPCFLGLLAVRADDISHFHANTHIPVVIGSQMRYEVTGDPLYREIGKYFMDIVNSSHSYATGGTSVDEFWSDPKRLATTLRTENEESCTTYNMLKVSRNLFRWTREMAYADYYERALTNGVLSIQRGTNPGVMIYMLPLGRGSSKARSYHGWGTQFKSFWCCYGTGIESFSKLGDSIYFEEQRESPTLYVVQYVSSVLDWKSGKITIVQKVDTICSSDPFIRVTLEFSVNEATGRSSTLKLRIPGWTESNKDAKGALNSENLQLPAPGNFFSATRQWRTGDKIVLELPVSLRTEAIKDDRIEYASIQAILFGPYLLAAHSHGDWDINVNSMKSLSEWIFPISSDYNSYLVSFSQDRGDSTFALTNSNQTVKMENFPESGTDSAVSATFRLVPDIPPPSHSIKQESSDRKVRLEPFDYPGMALVHYGPEKNLGVSDSYSAGASSVFYLVEGLDGSKESVSLESENCGGCFVYSGLNLGSTVKLVCKSQSSGEQFNRGASFVVRKGVSEYHPISFVARGSGRNFVLAPLLSFIDESYTVYFNITSS